MILLPAHNASEWTGDSGNNTYLFAGPPSVLIDAGVGHPEHLAALTRALAGAKLDTVLLTHSHFDHVAGVPALEARWPDVVIRGGPGIPLRDGETFVAADYRLSALYTPGHAPDHFCLVDRATDAIFCGDLARAGGTIVIPASKGGNLRAYLESLERVRAMKAPRLYPAHGPAIEDPAKLLDEYLAHRRLRHDQVKAALAKGMTDADAIVAFLYPGLSSTLQTAARESVLAHLEMLRSE